MKNKFRRFSCWKVNFFPFAPAWIRGFEPLRRLGEPVFLVESNPTVERIARLIYEQVQSAGLPVVSVKVWETPTSSATYEPAGTPVEA